MKLGKKAQAALEYILTYGWALIAIATIIGILIFATSGEINTTTCTTYLEFVCKGMGINDETLIMVMQNATGQQITINPINAFTFSGKNSNITIVYNGIEYTLDSVTIDPGAEFTLLISGISSP